MALVNGMRQGELLGLRWKDVDLDKGHLTISRTLSHDGRTFLLGGKTKIKFKKDTIAYINSSKAKKHRAVILKEKLSKGLILSILVLLIYI